MLRKWTVLIPRDRSFKCLNLQGWTWLKAFKPKISGSKLSDIQYVIRMKILNFKNIYHVIYIWLLGGKVFNNFVIQYQYSLPVIIYMCAENITGLLLYFVNLFDMNFHLFYFDRQGTERSVMINSILRFNSNAVEVQNQEKHFLTVCLSFSILKFHADGKSK